MHRKDVQAILLAVAIEPIAQKHGLAAADLVRHLRKLRPEMDVRTIERAAGWATASPKLPLT